MVTRKGHPEDLTVTRKTGTRIISGSLVGIELNQDLGISSTQNNRVHIDKEESDQKRFKVTNSSVHREFVRSGEDENVISKCRHCTKVYNTKNPSGLKNLLRKKHRDVDDESSRKEIIAKMGLKDTQEEKTQRILQLVQGWGQNLHK